MRENEVVQCINDLEKIQKDIEVNYDNIINRVEESSFRNIMGYFQTRCENLKYLKKTYQILPKIQLEELEIESIVSKFKILFKNFIEQYFMLNSQESSS